jgi:hypothetical protein
VAGAGRSCWNDLDAVLSRCPSREAASEARSEPKASEVDVEDSPTRLEFRIDFSVTMRVGEARSGETSTNQAPKTPGRRALLHGH